MFFNNVHNWKTFHLCETCNVFVKSCFGDKGLSTLNTNTERRFFVFSWLPMYQFYVFCHGQFLRRPIITQFALKPLAFMYPENMSLKISLSFPLEWTLVAQGQKLNHISVQRTGSPIGDLSRNYAFFAKFVAFKSSFCIQSCFFGKKNLGFGIYMGLWKSKIGLSIADTSSF